jgi:hypothetical protein
MSDTDKPALRPANDNPWYCLATLHGELPEEGEWRRKESLGKWPEDCDPDARASPARTEGPTRHTASRPTEAD